MRGPGTSEIVSIQKSLRSSVPPRRDGDDDSANLLLCSNCGFASSTGSEEQGKIFRFLRNVLVCL